MSELITRRTFLKATGAAALAVAASGMLAGCGEGYGATPGNPTLPTIDTGTYYYDFGCFYVDMGASERHLWIIPYYLQVGRMAAQLSLHRP